MKSALIFFLAIVVGSQTIISQSKPPDTASRAIQQKKVMVQKDRRLKNLTNRGDWRAWGIVYDHNKRGQAGLTVELWDKDLMFDDLLGRTQTDGGGKFSIRYQERDFKELTENKPDLYLVVKDRKGKSIYSSKRVPRYGAGKVERFTIVLKTKLTRKPKILKVKKK